MPNKSLGHDLFIYYSRKEKYCQNSNSNKRLPEAVILTQEVWYFVTVENCYNLKELLLKSILSGSKTTISGGGKKYEYQKNKNHTQKKLS